MELRDASRENFEKRIKFYKEKTFEQLLSIVPLWAYGNNVDYLLDKSLHPNEEEYLIFLVDMKELFRKTEFFEVNTNLLFTGDMLNDGRVATILYRWDTNKFIDPPNIGIFDRRKMTFSFSDGRHRTKTAFFLGQKQIPIAIHQTEIEDISKMINLIPI